MKKLALPPGAPRAALPVGVVLAAVVAGFAFGLEISLLVIAFGALLGVVVLLWASVQSLTGEAPLSLEEALGLGAPSAEEEQKRAVLRALKDLEFERSVGKISEEDYAELSARYREEAKRLMQLLDRSSEPARDRVDELVAARLASEQKKKQREAEERRRAADDEAASESDDDDGAEDASDSPESDARSAPVASEASPAPEPRSDDIPVKARTVAGETSPAASASTTRAGEEST